MTSIVLNASLNASSFNLPVTSCWAILTVLLSFNATSPVDFTAIKVQSESGQVLNELSILSIQNMSYIDKFKKTIYAPGNYQYRFTAKENFTEIQYILKENCYSHANSVQNTRTNATPKSFFFFLPVWVFLSWYFVCMIANHRRERSSENHPSETSQLIGMSTRMKSSEESSEQEEISQN